MARPGGAADSRTKLVLIAPAVAARGPVRLDQHRNATAVAPAASRANAPPIDSHAAASPTLNRVHDPYAPPEVLRALRIEPHASYVVAAFNPAAPPRLGAPDRRLDEDAPDWILAKFGKKRFAPLDLDLFDARGLEIVLMSGRHDVPAEVPGGAAAEGTPESP